MMGVLLDGFCRCKGVLRGLEQRLHETVYYMAERCYFMEVLFLVFW